jgi:hypothetical protein
MRIKWIDPDKLSAHIFIPASMYIFINALFIWKYVSHYLSHQFMAPLLYIVAAIIFIPVILNKNCFKFTILTHRKIYFSVALTAAIFLTILMLQFKPGEIEVGRYPALHDWITKLLNLEFPYESTAKPSGFPFLFILAMPFYFLGDLGAFQIFSFLLFTIALYFKFRDNTTVQLRLLILLIFSPIFLYEIVVRSDLFSNMAVVLFFLICCEKYGAGKSYFIQIILGLTAGFLLSTRGIVLFIYIPYFAFLFKNRGVKPRLFLPSMLTGFLITLIPFALWNWEYFINFGPFAVQLSYIPVWFVVLSIICSLIWAWKTKKTNDIYFIISTILFWVIFGAFIIFTVRFGLVNSVFGDKFDISYFCFALPFLLLSLGAATAREKNIKGSS